MERLIRNLFLMLLIGVAFVGADAQTTAFNYQGNLVVGGVPANGNYDFQFSLFSAASGGSPIGLGAGVSNVGVNNGTFSVLVNFGNQFPGTERWLEIRVRPAGQGSFTTLAPRQIIASSPYSVKSINTELLGGVPASQYVLTNDSRLSDARTPLPNSASYIQNRTTPQTASNFNISGNGTVGGSLSVVAASTFQNALTVGATLSIGGGAGVGGNLNVSGTVNTGSQFNIGGNFALGRSRLDLFNTDVTPRGFTFEVLNNPEYLIVKNDLGSTLMTIAPDGKVGIGDNNPMEATLEIGGTLAVSNLGGSNGDHLCRVGDLIRACPAARSDLSGTTKLAALESLVRKQQVEIERQRSELAALKNLVCSQNPAAEVCDPRQ